MDRLSPAMTNLLTDPLARIPAPPPRKARGPATLADIPHVWDGEILMTTVRGAADLLGVTPQTVRNWIRAGKIAGVRRQAGGTRPWVPVRHLWQGAGGAEWYQRLLGQMQERAERADASKKQDVLTDGVEK